MRVPALFRACGLALLLAGAVAARAGAQSAIVRGVVVSSTGNEGLTAAIVTALPAGRSARADESGRFAIAGLPPGPVTLRARSLGYRPAETTVTVPAEGTVEVTIRLQPSPITLAPVRTEARGGDRERFENSPDGGVISMRAINLRELPSVGEPDVLRLVQMLSGVTARNDFTAGYNVRGGESDQNLVLLDGIPVYNPFHLGGLFGTFLEPAVGEIKLHTGAFPASYGGRLSSVLEVSSREDARQGVHGVVGVSLLASSALVGGGMPGGQGTWSIGARRTYADALIGAFSERVLPYHFRDAQLHVAHLLPRGNGTVSVTAYDGQDVLDGSFADFGDSVAGAGTFRLDWGNRLAGVTFVIPLGERVRIPTGIATEGLWLGDSAWFVQRASLSRFETNLDLGGGVLAFRNSVMDRRLAGSLSWFRGGHAWNAGYDVTSHQVRYRVRSPETVADFFSLDQNPVALAAFVEDAWRPSPRWLVRPGVRVEHVTSTGWIGVSPRLAAKYFLTPDVALLGGAGQYAQWMHALRNEDLPIRIFDFWIASDRDIAVTRALQGSGGMEAWFSPRRFVRFEGWVKRYERLLEPNDAADPDVRGSEFVPLAGLSYGADVLLRQLEAGPVSGWVAYGYSVSSRTRDGARYFPGQDRRHNLNAVVAWHPSNRTTIGARLGYASGTPYTAIVGQLVRRVYDPRRNAWDTGIEDRQVEPVGGDRNAARLPVFHRLDLSVARRYERGRTTWEPYLQLVNAYNRRNVFTYTFDYTRNPPARSAISQFPFLPSIGVTVEF